MRTGPSWVVTGTPSADGSPATKAQVLAAVRGRLGNGALAEVAFLAGAAARPGACDRKIDFAVSQGVDWEIAVDVRGMSSRTSGGIVVPVLRLSGLVLPDRMGFESLVDATGQELVTRWTGGGAPDLWTRGPAALLQGE